MRRASIGIDEVASRETLLGAFASAALAKTGRYAVEVFRANLEERMRDLQSELLSGIYQPDPMRAFSAGRTRSQLSSKQENLEPHNVNCYRDLLCLRCG